MFKNIEKIFKTLILVNCFISIVITLKIFIRNNYNLLEMSTGSNNYYYIWLYMVLFSL